MKTHTPAESASAVTDAKAGSLGDWRAKTFEQIRRLILDADPEIIEERKWVKPSNPAGVPIFSRGGIVCTGETYKDHLKFTFAKGASLPDPARLFNSSLEGNLRRAIDLHQGDKLNEAAFTQLIRAAVALNLNPQSKSGRPPAHSRPRSGVRIAKKTSS